MTPFRSTRGPGLAANTAEAPARAPNVPQPQARAPRQDWRGVFGEATIAGLRDTAASGAALEAVAPLSPRSVFPTAPL